MATIVAGTCTDVAKLKAMLKRGRQINAHWRKHGTWDGLDLTEDEWATIQSDLNSWINNDSARGRPLPLCRYRLWCIEQRIKQIEGAAA